MVIDPHGTADVPDDLRASFNPLDLIDANNDDAIDLASAIGDAIMIGSGDGSVLVENLLASVSQHQRQKNGEQTKNRMRARTSAGYWCFPPPVGYRFETIKGHGKLLVPDEPVATILRQAFEGYASGRFET